MSTSSPDANDTPTQSAPDEVDGINPWVVRLFLILAFGLAFGIEGMTLIRSYLIDGEEEAEEQVEYEEGRGDTGADATPLHIGDDLLPTTTVSERVAEMQIRGRSDGPWIFRMVVTIANDREDAVRLSLRDLEADDGTVFDNEQSVTCPPGDSTRLVASWPIGNDARPASLIAESERQGQGDSLRTVRRRVSFGHVPVRMER